MPLPLPQLDDKTFAQLMEDARKLLPRYAPDWTDYNTHDPGITFIELFAWLTEIQRYYLDRVRDENYLKFLKLLGIRLKDATSAITDVNFSFVEKQPILPIWLPKGTKVNINTNNTNNLVTTQESNLQYLNPSDCVSEEEKLVFETDSPVLITPTKLEQIISSSISGRKDNTDANYHEKLSYYAFGENAETGNYLYLGFNLLYIFDWDKVSGRENNIDNERLKDYLNYYLGFTWLKNLDCGAICKSDCEKVITITDGQQQLIFEIDESNNIVKLFINENYIDSIYFLIQNENNCKGIYGQPFPAQKTLNLKFNLYENYPIRQNKFPEQISDFIPSATIAWEYYNSQNNWTELQIEDDETLMLSKSGRFWFTTPNDMGIRNIFPFPKQLYWLRAKVQQAGYELPPKINTIRLNTISITQKNTVSEVKTFSSDNNHTQSISASYVALAGDNILQVRQFDLTLLLTIFCLKPVDITYWVFIILQINQELKAEDGCWKDWSNYNLYKDEIEGTITFTFDSKIPPQGKNNIRVISYLFDFENLLFLGRSNGLPYQTFSLQSLSVASATLKVQVREKSNKDYLWRDWNRVDDFHGSKPKDPHYIFDSENGLIRFGDGINGDIPQVPLSLSEKNIRIISCQTIAGEKGNVEAKTINQFWHPIYTYERELKVENLEQVSGGSEKETLERGKLRARKDLKQISRTVTDKDFELLALSTPGLRVARAKAIISKSEDAKSLVKIVVVPDSESPKPQPSKGFLQNVSRYLESRRLITTQLQVIPPIYVEISVKATVIIKAGYNPEQIRNQINKTLTEEFLHPLNGGNEGKGWSFGRTVYKSEIYQVMDKTFGVDYVESLELFIMNADKNTNPRFKDGNIEISPYSLICSNKHKIKILTYSENR